MLYEKRSCRCAHWSLRSRRLGTYCVVSARLTQFILSLATYFKVAPRNQRSNEAVDIGGNGRGGDNDGMTVIRAVFGERTGEKKTQDLFARDTDNDKGNDNDNEGNSVAIDKAMLLETAHKHGAVPYGNANNDDHVAAMMNQQSLFTSIASTAAKVKHSERKVCALLL